MTPYNLKREAFERMKPELDQILEKGDTSFPTESPHNLAYRIREAIRAAKANNIAKYKDLDVSVKDKGDHVTVVHRKTLVKGKAVHSFVDQEEITNEYEAVAFLRNATTGHYRFPNFKGNISAVDRWASSNKCVVVQLTPPIIEKQ